ncbi:MAG: hypothetical protein HWE35_00695 [Rhodobacteraceae bacterium]|nr:hypothetical protein [Paracoccaceae bacterium]
MKRNLRLVLAVAGAVMGLAVYVLETAEPQYAVEAALALDDGSTRIDPGTSLMRRSRMTQAMAMTELEVLRSRSFAAGVAGRLGLAADPGFMARAGLSGLPPAEAAAAHLMGIYSVSLRHRSLVVSIQVRDADGPRAERIANGIAAAYMEQTLSAQRAEAGRSIRLMERRISDLSSGISAAEQELSVLMRANGLDDREAQMQLIIQLRQAYQRLEQQSAGEDAEARANEEFAGLTAALKERARALQARKTLERRLEEMRSRHAALSRQLSTLRSQADLMEPAGRQIARAQAPPAPNLPNRKTLLAGSLVIALSLAFVAVLLREALDGRVRAGQPALRGAVHFPPVPRARRRTAPELTELLTRKGRMGAAAVAAQQILTFLRCRGGAAGSGLVVPVTSVQCLDGRSLVSMCLALSAARDGNRVLLVCLDGSGDKWSAAGGLPRSGHVFEDLLEEPGLMMGEIRKDLDWLDVLVPAAGSQVPLEFTHRPMGERGFALLRQRYDLILIDTPPVLESAAASRLGAAAQVLLLVVRDGRTSGAALSQALEVLSRAGPPPMVILNTA